LIEFNNVSFGYVKGERILNNISFKINAGEFVAIIGENGSGKTTLLKHLNGLLRPNEGNILISNENIFYQKTSNLAGKIGFVFQNPDHQIFCTTVREEIGFGLKNNKDDFTESKIENAARKLNLEKHLERNPFELSKGLRQRVALASVLVMNPDILVLDEPTTGQDYKESLEIMEVVKKLNKEGKTIIIVSHDMELVLSYAKRSILMKDGSVLKDGLVEEVLSDSENLKKSGIVPPQIVLLRNSLYKYSIFKNCLSTEDMLSAIVKYTEGSDIQ
jgi:energy-coupling factor transport system ATP-binding protein